MTTALYVAVLLPFNNSEAAVIIPTGGAISANLSTVPINSGYGNYTVTGTYQFAAVDAEHYPIPELVSRDLSRLSSEIRPSFILVTGRADGASFFTAPPSYESYILGSAHAEIGFDLTATSSVRFTWSGNIGEDSDASIAVFKKNFTEGIELECIKFYSNASCGINGGDKYLGPSSGTLALPAGNYQFVADVSAGHGMGLNFPGEFSFQLAIVPIPASIWLFGMCSIGLYGLSRYRRSNVPDKSD
ncbi:hypothetical protein [Methylococcus sp. EFPC2]|uniref:hypothetical protein n=1 Tax=Methylococcus sp. EFPC2 TaxID=2812648 RepID=UPI001966F761|nr:hypothetical protein [Methylococcus sp. EFPC2]QSA98155.1 hypothetical protein JWZ97_04870 [Methylococcus sp. EFPC2]